MQPRASPGQVAADDRAAALAAKRSAASSRRLDLALVAEGAASAARVAVFLGLGGVVLFMPGLARLVLLQMFAIHLAWGGTVAFVAAWYARRPCGCRDPRIVEPCLSIVAGVAIADFLNNLGPGTIFVMVAHGICSGALLLAQAKRDQGTQYRWRAAAGVASIAGGALLGIAAGALIMCPAAVARAIGSSALIYGPLPVVLTTWLPLQVMVFGPLMLMWSVRSLADLPVSAVSAYVWLGWFAFAGAAFIAVGSGFVVESMAAVVSILILVSLGPSTLVGRKLVGLVKDMLCSRRLARSRGQT